LFTKFFIKLLILFLKLHDFKLKELYRIAVIFHGFLFSCHFFNFNI